MNKARRTEIQQVIDDLATVEDSIKDIATRIETIKDEEQEYFDNMPESLQGGDKGNMAEEAIGNLDEAQQNTEEIDIGSPHAILGEILTMLTDAKEHVENIDIDTIKDSLENAAGG